MALGELRVKPFFRQHKFQQVLCCSLSLSFPLRTGRKCFPKQKGLMAHSKMKSAAPGTQQVRYLAGIISILSTKPCAQLLIPPPADYVLASASSTGETEECSQLIITPFCKKLLALGVHLSEGTREMAITSACSLTFPYVMTILIMTAK